MDDKKRLIEAALFVAAKPLSLADLYQVLKIPKSRIKKIIDEMKGHYDGHGVRIVEADGLYEMKIDQGFEGHVSHLAPHKDFPKAVLQTLSLIAYKNPVKQSNIVEVRGNRAYDHLRELEAKSFIRREESGHTNIVHITRKFLDYFGLENADELREYFSSTPIDMVLKDVETKKKKINPLKEEKEEAVAIDSHDVSFSGDSDLPEKMRAIVEKKKEEILKRRKKKMPDGGETVSEDVSEIDAEKEDDNSIETEKEDDAVKEEIPKKFRSSFDEVLE
ncbi:MAG: SMC-Scp complex subunit ScpB [Candidatus Aenigmarchaeota archaeon]|nr:SMC-Scp complex subunit ScpB [Candidatus Aenigmarchaeota archaeon]